MKKVISLLVVLVLSTLTTTATAQAVLYTFGAPCPYTCATDGCNGVGNASWTILNTAIFSSASDFNLGPGISGVGSSPCGSMNGFAAGNPSNPNRARWADNWTLTNSVNPGDYFTFTVTPNPFYAVQINYVAWVEQRSNSGPREGVVRVSTDGFLTYTSYPITSTTGTGWVSKIVNIGPPSLSGPIEIRIYKYSATGSAGSLRIDNVQIDATVTLTNLSIKLVLFEASAEIDKVRLNWTTASELNNDYFTVLRSADPSSESWEEVAKVDGAGTSLMSLDYEAFDDDPLNGISYYKLRQTDFDGTFSDSPVVSVNFNQDRTRSLVLRIGNMAFLEGQTSYLIDASGKILGNQKVHTLMQAGTYFLKGEDGRVLRLLVLE